MLRLIGNTLDIISKIYSSNLSNDSSSHIGLSLLVSYSMFLNYSIVLSIFFIMHDYILFLIHCACCVILFDKIPIIHRAIATITVYIIFA